MPSRAGGASPAPALLPGPSFTGAWALVVGLGVHDSNL